MPIPVTADALRWRAGDRPLHIERVRRQHRRCRRGSGARLAEFQSELPIGLEVHKVHWQSDVVSEAVDGFHAFVEALVIIIVVVTLFMGWRMGVVIGFALIFTLCATFTVMALAGIDLQRVSLGALVIALGMMVDNAIVTADGYLLRCQKGMSPRLRRSRLGQSHPCRCSAAPSSR